MAGPDDMRADLILTMADGYRLPPLTFTVPISDAYQSLLQVRSQQFDLAILEIQNRAARQERQLDAALDRELKAQSSRSWWRRKKSQ
jgi:hypothetical protein